jgi:hypothetical protein
LAHHAPFAARNNPSVPLKEIFICGARLNPLQQRAAARVERHARATGLARHAAPVRARAR